MIVESLVANTSLKMLDMAHSRKITSQVWIRCFRLLYDARSNLESLYLDTNHIDNEGAKLLVELLVDNHSVSTLEIRYNHLITTDGWTAFAGLLHPTSSSKLRVLMLDADDHESDVDSYIIAFTEALANNTGLERLGLFGKNFLGRYDDDNYEIPEKGWNALAKALCDASSLTSVRASNHTLHDIWDGSDECYSFDYFPSNVHSMLNMNRENKKAAVVRNKWNTPSRNLERR